MVAIAVGLLVVAAMAALLARSSAARTETERTSQQIESGRFALQLLADDIRLAGYYGGVAGGTGRIVEACLPRAGVAATATTLGWQPSPVQYPLAVHGYAGGDTPASESCLASQKPGTDALILRSVETSPTALADAGNAAGANDFFLQSSACADEAVDPPGVQFVVAGGGPAAAARFILHQKDCTTLAPLRKLVVHAWYVGRCSVCSGSGDGIPSLRVVEFNGATAASQSVVEGIDALRVDYAQDTDGDGETDRMRRCKLAVDPCAPEDWNNVIAVQVHVLARSLTPTAGHVDDKAYDMGLAGIVPAANDGYRRHLYSALVLAPNLAGPRER